MEFEWGKCQPFHRFDEPALFGPIDEFRLVAEPCRGNRTAFRTAQSEFGTCLLCRDGVFIVKAVCVDALLELWPDHGTAIGK